MKLLYISTARLPTGRAHGLQIMYMCREFARTGALVELVVPAKHNFQDGADPFEYYGIPRNFNIRRIPIPDLGSKSMMFPKLFLLVDMLSFALGLLVSRVIRSADVVYCRDYPLLFLCPPRRNRVVIEIHDISRWRFVFRRALQRADTIVAITHGLKEALVNMGIDPKRIIVAPDAVRLEDFEHPESKEVSRARLGLPLDKKIAMYIGRLDGWKGTDVFFAAAALFPQDVRAVVIGGEVKEVEKLSRMHPHITFLGKRPYRELADNQGAADVLILTISGKFEVSSLYTSPLKLFSYMASDKPIVASDLPSIREVLDTRSAYLVAPDDAQVLARGVEEALRDPKAHERAARARELVKNYTWEGRAREILATIKRV